MGAGGRLPRPGQERFAKNLMDIVGWMGERYKDKIKAWWFDSPYSLDPRGPHNSVTTDMTGFQFPWERFTVAAKIGYPARLVTYNAGVARPSSTRPIRTTGPGNWSTSRPRPRAAILPNGLQWFGWTCLEDRAWVTPKLDTRDPQAALFRRGDRLLRPHLQFPPGPDDVQRRHLPGRHDGPGVGGAVASAWGCTWQAVGNDARQTRD